ncbi:MAG TPA: hypothetical protein VEJ18_00860, partial [Planctomycetota bacterium]|nr:hypothetical protein [Planctomycetota bacterium]
MKTVADLKASGARMVPVKEEMRRNLIRTMKSGAPLFPGLIGYDQTVLPALQNAILARHDFILLGLRGQGKSRLLRALVELLDEKVPVVPGCEINDHPLAPLCKRCRRTVTDQTEIGWLGREDRYRENVARVAAAVPTALRERQERALGRRHHRRNAVRVIAVGP